MSLRFRWYFFFAMLSRFFVALVSRLKFDTIFVLYVNFFLSEEFYMKLCSKLFKTFFSLTILLGISSCIGGDSHKFNVENAIGRENLVDILIAGSGPAGLTAAIHGSRSRFNTLVLEGPNPGGQLMRTTWVENFPGVEKIRGPELIAAMRKQAEGFGAEFVADSVKDIDFSSWPYRVTTANDMIIHAMSVIVATGASPRKLGIPGEEEYWGKGVGTCAICDGPLYRDEEVVVVGGGDSAVEEAIQLVNFGVAKVTVLVRSDKMRAIRIMQERIKEEESVFIKHNTLVKEVVGDGTFVTGVRVLDKISGEEYVIPASGVFLAIGSEPNTWFVKDVVNMDQRGYLILQERTQKTSKEGVFAAGDVEAERQHQAIIACGTGAQACIEAVDDWLTREIGLSRKIMNKLKDNYYKQKVSGATSVTLQEIKTVETFKKEVLESKIPVIVDFYTQACTSCKKMEPTIKAFAKDYANKVKVVKIDAGVAFDITSLIKNTYNVGITKVPYVVIFKDGKLLEHTQSALTRKELSDLVSKHL